EIQAGEYTLAAWSDQNSNRAVDDGDYFGVYPLVVVAEGQSVTGIDIALQSVIGTNAAGKAVAPAIARALEALLPAR
ncbi:MAG TPA: hypothetical protein VNM90_02695, partial [Haliangium sp.]|nr:hypothetical protein [Haliangium sp.]